MGLQSTADGLDEGLELPRPQEVHGQKESSFHFSILDERPKQNILAARQLT